MSERAGQPSAHNRPGEVFVDELFDELMELPPDDRLPALERRTADDSLRAELRALLAMVEELPPREEEATPTTPRGGVRIAHYRLGTNLGEGASGSVWTAFDTRLQAWTALKLFHGERLPTERALATVMREARAASGIISDHVVLIRNAGKDDGTGLHFIEMLLCAEYRADDNGQERLVVGRNLSEDPPDDPAESVRLVAEACRGAEAAHRVGVVHRDIKPANILVMPVSRRSLVADFGLSAPELRPSPESAAPTETVSLLLKDDKRVVVGTPCFMAPEQARGEPATRQSDVYALGATLYTLLAGQAPYLEPGAERPDAMTIVRQARQVPPKALAELAPRTPRRLVRIVERAMSRDPADRYPTAADLARDLEAWRTQRPTSLDGRNPVLSAWLTARRNPVPVATGLTLLVILLVFGVSTAWLAGVKDDLEQDVRVLEDRRMAAEALAAEAETRAELAARDADAAAEQSRRAAEQSALAADHAREARAELEEIRSWAAAETDQARADRQEAIVRAGEADVRAAEAELVAAQAREAQEAAETERAAAERALAEARAALAGVRVELDDEKARHRGDLMRLVEADHRQRELETEIERLKAQVRDLTPPPPVVVAPE